MKTNYLPSDELSLEYHRLVVKKLQEDPRLISKVLENIRRWKTQNQNPQPYLDEWLDHIEKGLEPLCVFLLSSTEEGQRLRSSSPFVGLITQEERSQIRERFKT